MPREFKEKLPAHAADIAHVSEEQAAGLIIASTVAGPDLLKLVGDDRGCTALPLSVRCKHFPIRQVGLQGCSTGLFGDSSKALNDSGYSKVRLRPTIAHDK